ncbi:hypothetical protein H4219_001519 [Mycoemilia scoparia]|uniref:WD40 repeat-like protein n=1 Tax=Mycoemilia scoparia TaxID=417184 RepID=A0A9W8DQ98_9FUNG|nr:hypothetical protein H4219_001519 [Mycoemilia scoparia]
MQDSYTAFAAKADLDQEEMETMRREIKNMRSRLEDLERENRVLKQRNYDLSFRYGKALQTYNNPYNLVFSDPDDEKVMENTSTNIDSVQVVDTQDEPRNDYYVKASDQQSKGAERPETSEQGYLGNTDASANNGNVKISDLTSSSPGGVFRNAALGITATAPIAKPASTKAVEGTGPLAATKPNSNSIQSTDSTINKSTEVESTDGSMKLPPKDKHAKSREERHGGDRRKGAHRLNFVGDLEGHEGAIYSVQYAPNRSVIASASLDQTVRLWDVGKQKQISRLTGHQSLVFDVAWRSDGEAIGTASLDQSCIIWDVEQEKEITKFMCSGAGQSIAFSTQAQHISFASDSTGKIYIFDSRSPDTRNVLDNGANNNASTLYCFHDKMRLASGDNNGDIKIWDVRNGKYITLVEGGPGAHPISCISVLEMENSNVEYMAANSYDNVLRVYGDINDTTSSSPKVIREIRGHKNRNWPIKNAFFNNTTTQNMIHDLFMGVDYYQMSSRHDISSRKKSLSNLFIITGSAEPYAYVHKINPRINPLLQSQDDKSNQDLVQKLEGHSDRVYAVATHPWEPQACTAGADSSIHIFVDNMAEAKRKDLDNYNENAGQFSSAVVVKKSKANNDDGNASSGVVIQSDSGSGGGGVVVKATIKRSSGLAHPIMRLTGHEGSILSCKFNHSGEHFASASSDKTILLWNTYGECKNYGILRGHTGAVLEVCWSPDDSQIFSASSDNTLGIWDTESGERIRKLKGHTKIVNSCCTKPRFSGESFIIGSGSDDGTIKIWDSRQKSHVQEFENRWPVTSVCFSANGDTIFSGSIDNNIIAWDIRMEKHEYVLKGHSDTVTGLSLAPVTGHHLVSASMDNTVRLWDIQPFTTLPTRCEAVYGGAPHGFEKNLIRPSFSNDEAMIVSGSGDRSVTIWDKRTANIRYKLPGHTGTVNDVDWHPKEPIVLTASADHTLYLGEIDPNAS